MYKLLIVDDEPIIISGIKSIVNWEEHDATIAGTARNGKEAYDFIALHHPDIVIADIKMPIMDGISLLKKCNETYPDIVFIILTSLEEFRLAKEAISYRAVDYLLKTELNEDLMVKSLEKAIVESSFRKTIYGSSASGIDDVETIEDHVSKLFKFRKIMPERKMAMEKAGLLTSYAFIAIILPCVDSEDEESFASDMEKRFGWEREIAERCISACFSHYYFVTPVSNRNTVLVFFLSQNSNLGWNRNMTQVREKIWNASKMVLNENITFLTSSRSYAGSEELEEARADLEKQYSRYYLSRDDVKLEELRLDNALYKIESVLKSKELQDFEVVMNLVDERFSNIDHSPAQAAIFLEALSFAIRSGFKDTDLELEGSRIADALERDLYYVTRLSDTLKILHGVRQDVSQLLSSDGSHNEAIARAKTFILSNLDKPLSLAEIAAFACVSPGYLSALFRKTTGESLVEYMNNSKMNAAKEMIRNGARRVDELAAAFGFNNTYYFSKVFKKATGLPPTEYIMKIDNIKK